MRKLIVTINLFLCLTFLPTIVLAMSCPSNNNILQIGDSTQEVLTSCGQPASTNTITNIIPLESEWIYYIPNTQTNAITKLTLTFSYNKIRNINILLNSTTGENQYILFFDQCKSPLIISNTGISISTNNTMRMSRISVGDTMEFVKSACGNPISEKTLKTLTTQTTQWKYHERDHNTLIFENDKLIDWK